MERLLSWLLMGASLAQKARPALREFTPAMQVRQKCIKVKIKMLFCTFFIKYEYSLLQIAWFAACQLLIYFVLRILFGLFF